MGDASAPDATTHFSQIKRIYIQSFTGQNIREVQEVFWESVAEQDVFTFVELLPDDYINLKILRIEVVDYAIWENDEKITMSDPYLKAIDTTDDVLKRRNAIVSLRISLFDAESGTLLIRKTYSQPFQQIYIGTEAISSMPDQQLELRRLMKILIFRIFADFYQVQHKVTELDLEDGFGYDWFSLHVHNIGYKRLKKGIRLAMAGDYDQAIWVWKLVLFKPENEEPLEIYRKNRASAYYNLGVVYDRKDEWLQAASMFSKANRLIQKLKYAQAWGNTMQDWLDEQKKSTSDYVDLTSLKERKKGVKVLDQDKAKTIQKEEEEDFLLSIEKNEQFLLKARELWPLEPILKFTDTEEPLPMEIPEDMIEEEPIEVEEDFKLQPIKPEEPIKPQEPDTLELEDDLIRRVPSGSGNSL